MPTSRLTVCLAIFMAGGVLSLLVPAAYAQPTAAAPRISGTDTNCPRNALLSSTRASNSLSVPEMPKRPKPLKLAQLDYPVPPTASAAELLQAADDYAVYADWVNYRAYLQQVATSHPGTKEAGLALALLADEYASIGDAGKAETCDAQLAGYADAEVQAFATLCRTAFPAQRARQNDVYETTLASYAAQWKATPSGGRAALSLADYYRFTALDYPKALAAYQGVVTDCAGTLIAEEAQVSLAEALDWSVPSQPEQSRAAFEAALSAVHYPGLQVRCVLGLADLLSKSGWLDQALDSLTQLITTYPGHPAVTHAYALRSITAERLGNWDLAVSDARAFLAKAVVGSFNLARCHTVLAKDAYRKGNLDEAAAQFTAAAQLAEADNHTSDTTRLGGPAQAGLAAVAAARGDVRGALQAYLKAADLEGVSEKKATYLFLAAGAADKVGDTATRAQIIARMTAETPGSAYTTKVVGHEVLPAPGI